MITNMLRFRLARQGRATMIVSMLTKRNAR